LILKTVATGGLKHYITILYHILILQSNNFGILSRFGLAFAETSAHPTIFLVLSSMRNPTAAGFIMVRIVGKDKKKFVARLPCVMNSMG